MSHITIRIPKETISHIRDYAMSHKIKRGRRPDVSAAIRSLIAIGLRPRVARRPKSHSPSSRKSTRQ